MTSDFSKIDGADLEQSPKRGARAPRKGPPIQRPGTSGKPSLKAGIGGMLVMLNLPVQMFDPLDALDPAELDALASGIDEQCKISPRFRRYVESMLGVGTGSQLLATAGMIVGRRLARHHVLGDGGEQVDRVLGERLQEMTGEQAMMPAYPKPAEAPPAQAPYVPPVEPPGGFTGMPVAGNPNAGT